MISLLERVWDQRGNGRRGNVICTFTFLPLASFMLVCYQKQTAYFTLCSDCASFLALRQASRDITKYTARIVNFSEIRQRGPRIRAPSQRMRRREPRRLVRLCSVRALQPYSVLQSASLSNDLSPCLPGPAILIRRLTST